MNSVKRETRCHACPGLDQVEEEEGRTRTPCLPSSGFAGLRISQHVFASRKSSNHVPSDHLGVNSPLLTKTPPAADTQNFWSFHCSCSRQGPRRNQTSQTEANSGLSGRGGHSFPMSTQCSNLAFTAFALSMVEMVAIIRMSAPASTPAPGTPDSRKETEQRCHRVLRPTNTREVDHNWAD